MLKKVLEKVTSVLAWPLFVAGTTATINATWRLTNLVFDHEEIASKKEET